MRGIGRLTDYNNRILILLNGHPVQEAVTGGSPVGVELGIDPRVLERVEIVRGPASALYGTGAMLAVVNLVTRAADSGDAVAVQLGTTGVLGATAQRFLSLRRGGSLFVSVRGGTSEGGDHDYPDTVALDM